MPPDAPKPPGSRITGGPADISHETVPGRPGSETVVTRASRGARVESEEGS